MADQKTTTHESEKVKDARARRADALSTAVFDWAQLARMHQYPRSLHDIVLSGLRREYRLGQCSVKKSRTR